MLIQFVKNRDQLSNDTDAVPKFSEWAGKNIENIFGTLSGHKKEVKELKKKRKEWIEEVTVKYAKKEAKELGDAYEKLAEKDKENKMEELLNHNRIIAKSDVEDEINKTRLKDPFYHLTTRDAKVLKFSLFLLYVGNRFSSDTKILTRVITSMNENIKLNGDLVKYVSVALEVATFTNEHYRSEKNKKSGLWGFKSWSTVNLFATEMKKAATLTVDTNQGLEFLGRGFLSNFMTFGECLNKFKGLLKHYDALFLAPDEALPKEEVTVRPNLDFGVLRKSNLKFLKFVDPLILMNCQGMISDLERSNAILAIYMVYNKLFGTEFKTPEFEAANSQHHKKQVVAAAKLIKDKKDILIQSEKSVSKDRSLKARLKDIKTVIDDEFLKSIDVQFKRVVIENNDNK